MFLFMSKSLIKVLILYKTLSTVESYLVFSHGGLYKIVIGWAIPVDVPMSVIYAQNIQFQYAMVSNASMYSLVFQEERKLNKPVTRNRLIRAIQPYIDRECLLYLICESAAIPLINSGLVGELLQTLLKPSVHSDNEFITAWNKGHTFRTNVVCLQLSSADGMRFHPLARAEDGLHLSETYDLNRTKNLLLMAKASTVKDAIKRWEERTGQNSAEAKEVGLQFQWLPIEKMDNSFGQLVKCEKLSLSTNMIEKISGLGGLKYLKVLSLGRNYIKTFSGLEPVADTLEELWISYNLIEKIKGVGVLRKLKVLYMSNNLVKDWAEFIKLQECPELEDLLFVGNPLCDSLEEAIWRAEAVKRLPNLKKLDGEPVISDVV